MTRKLNRLLRKINIFLRIPVSLSLQKFTSGMSKRLLIIYDTNYQPYSVGDTIIFLEAGLVLCAEKNLEKLDFAIVYNPETPDIVDPVFSGVVNSDNVLLNLGKILPLAQLIEQSGSILIFNSQIQLNKYINDNVGSYEVWPSQLDRAKSAYLSPKIFNDLLYKYYKNNNNLPTIEGKKYLNDWARFFFSNKFPGKIPVTINLRYNKKWHQGRNARIQEWLEFFEYCQAKYPIVFIVLSSIDEVCSEFRRCDNVVYAKEFNTTLEEDLALIRNSSAHMGSSSGPATIAWFNENPYLIFKPQSSLLDGFFRYDSMINIAEDEESFWFAKENQKFIINNETSQVMISFFENIWNGSLKKKYAAILRK
jgi:hypothetical protein